MEVKTKETVFKYGLFVGGIIIGAIYIYGVIAILPKPAKGEAPQHRALKFGLKPQQIFDPL